VIINQWAPAAHRGDAIGDSARKVRDLLRRMGHVSDLYALTIDDDLKGDVRPYDHPGARAGAITIFHFALPSPMTEAFTSLPRGRVLQYHNVTPAHFFAPYDPALFRLAALGRSELASLAGHVDLALGDSEDNRAELVNFLFVGRVAPNKRLEDIIRLAEHYKRYVDAYYRFIFVGRCDGVPRYYASVRALIAEYDMLPERFLFTGPVPDVELAAYYRAAAVYISMSEHEGFCVPLVEAMAAGVPVLAYAAAAVPDTLAGAGVQFAPKDPEHAAELLGALAFDENLRHAVIAGQRRRLADFADDRMERQLRSLVSTLS
jgi:glycosyltransferase involved in cell wall biosynthesis